MSKIWASKYFKMVEIVPRVGGDLSMFHPDYPEFLDAIRGILGPMVINDYHKGGQRQWRGLRLPSCPQWRPGSQHSYVKASGKLCAAFDATCLDHSAASARELLLAQAPALLGRLEDGVSWLHADMGPRRGGCVHVFRP